MKGKIRPFKSVETAHPGRSVFDLSYSKLFTCDMGQLIPIMCDEVVPGDKFNIGNEMVIRFNPLVAPVLHPINAYVHYFFVPYRILWGEATGEEGGWEQFITGGVDGDDDSTLPFWIPHAEGDYYAENDVGSLWDYIGLPVNAWLSEGHYPLDFPRRAYWLIWNDYYRDETLQTEKDLTQNSEDAGSPYNGTTEFYASFNTNRPIFMPANRNWTKDYFTSALPWQQRGTAPALPISGTTSAVFDGSTSPTQSLPVQFNGETGAVNGQRTSGVHALSEIDAMGGTTAVTAALTALLTYEELNAINNTVDLSTASTFNIADLRLAFQIQKFLERTARGGARYTEFLHAMFGVSPRDDRLQRPEYIGGSKSPIVISEVLQTSATGLSGGLSPQGNMSGHALSASQQFCGKYFAQEYGLIMGILSVMPVPMYSQGINRQWLKQSKFDFFNPVFTQLSEQAITQEEIFCGLPDALGTIFGYQGRFDEMRYKPNQVNSLMNPGSGDSFDSWNMSRYFDTAPALNSDFILCIPDKRIFAAETQPGLLVSFGNLIKAIRPLPVMGTPGYIDHH